MVSEEIHCQVWSVPVHRLMDEHRRKLSAFFLKLRRKVSLCPVLLWCGLPVLWDSWVHFLHEALVCNSCSKKSHAENMCKSDLCCVFLRNYLWHFLRNMGLLGPCTMTTVIYCASICCVCKTGWIDAGMAWYGVQCVTALLPWPFIWRLSVEIICDCSEDSI
jgi:hypothetical protein